MSTTRTLIAIPISHYCEKARWALDRAGLAYTERRHLQLFHRLPVLLAKGGRTTPVLTAEGQTYPESADILRYCDRHVGESHQLYPQAHEAEIVEMERELDEGFGVATRKLFYFYMKAAGRSYFLALNNQGAPWWQRMSMHALYPAASLYAAKYLDINERTVDAAKREIADVLDSVEKRLCDGRPFFFGDQFTAVDLAFAALSAPITLPPEYGVPLPPRESVPAALETMLRNFEPHPALEFAQRLYREQRHRVHAHVGATTSEVRAAEPR